MTPLWWAVAALAAPAAPAAEAPSLAAWHGRWAGEGEAFGKPATATLDIASGEGGATTLAYRLSIAGTPRVAYSAGASYAFDAKGRVRKMDRQHWPDARGRRRGECGEMVDTLGQRRCRDRPVDLCP